MRREIKRRASNTDEPIEGVEVREYEYRGFHYRLEGSGMTDEQWAELVRVAKRDIDGMLGFEN